MEKIKEPGLFDQCRKAGEDLEEMVRLFQQSPEYYTLMENNLVDSDREVAHFSIILHICEEFYYGRPVVFHLWDEKNKKFVEKRFN